MSISTNIRNFDRAAVAPAARQVALADESFRPCPPVSDVQNDHTSNVASPSSKPMLKMSVAVVRKMLDAVAGSAP